MMNMTQYIVQVYTKTTTKMTTKMMTKTKTTTKTKQNIKIVMLNQRDQLRICYFPKNTM